MDKLPLFGDASRVIIVFSAKAEYKSFQDFPTIRFFFLNKENKDKLTELAEVLLEKEVIFKDNLEKIFGKRPHEREILE